MTTGIALGVGPSHNSACAGLGEQKHGTAPPCQLAAGHVAAGRLSAAAGVVATGAGTKAAVHPSILLQPLRQDAFHICPDHLNRTVGVNNPVAQLESR
ncbi:MAG: hypothetical protein U1F42_05120 [Candidatus Competibacteraceae bacterium]